MKKNKIIFASLAAVLGIFSFVLTALAGTTASLLPANIKITAGQQIIVMILVDPQGVGNYAEKIEVNYPADLLNVTTFNFGNNWMPLQQAGYDSIDNVNGVLIKTAGYPNGISSVAYFGTISFTAKKVGSGNITIGNGSQAFEVNSQSSITGAGASFAITSVATSPEKKATTNLLATSSISEQALQALTAESTSSLATSSQVAAVEASSPNNVWLWVLLFIAVVGVVGLWINSRKTDGTSGK